MAHEVDLNTLVSNILNENLYQHCRLCLGDIVDANRVKYDDLVSPDLEQQIFQPLSTILREMLDEEVCNEIPGLDSVCSDCVEKVLDFKKFKESCKNSTLLLHKIFDNLTDALNVEIKDGSNQHMYVILNELESKVILMDKENINVSKDENECTKCKQVFTDNEEFKKHIKICSGFKLKCPHCEQLRSTEKALQEHQDKVHKEYVCKDCGKTCTGLDKLHLHEERHNDKKLRCPKCDKVYVTKISYVKHVQLCLADKLEPHPFRNNYKKSYICDKCGKGYSTPGGLRVHERFEHGNAKHHVCEHCGKKFTSPSYLKIHMIKHTGEKKFRCTVCLKKFVSKEALLYHTRRHTGEKPFSCNKCNERFVNSSARSEHIKFKHTGPQLTCNICKKNFFTLSFLKQHTQRHYDPSSKLYAGRALIPPNVPGKQNLRIKTEDMSVVVEEESE